METSTPQSPRWPPPTTLEPWARPTWEAWLAWLARHNAWTGKRPEAMPWTEGERARLRFHRWLYERGRLPP